MRTFEQYIEESVDFRLGGSKNKGAVDKTFGELKDGDVFYRYSIDISSRRFTKNPCKCIFECIDGNKMRYFFDDRKSDIARFTMFVDKDKSMASHTYGVSAGHGLYYVYSTIEYDEATIIEKIEELSKKADKDVNVYVYESVDFRLGGKNNVDSGSFAFSHLRLGDDVYCVNVDTRNWKVIEREQGVFEGSKEMYERMFVYFRVNKRTCSCPVLKEEYEISSVHIEPSLIYDNGAKIYSTYYVEDDEAIELAKEWKNDLKESVDFRLGGRNKKGFNQTKYKSFRDLEKGDIIYEFDSETEEGYEQIFQELEIDVTATIKTINAFGFKDSYIIDKNALDDSFYIFQKIHCLVTSEEEMIDIAKKEFGVKLRDEDIARL